jgi:hypothetical protein
MEGTKMTENAKKVYEIVKRAGFDALLENTVDDLEAFAEGIPEDATEQEILNAFYISLWV